MKNHSSFISSFKILALQLLIPTILAVFLISTITNLVFENHIVVKSEVSGAAKINRILNQNHVEEIPILGSSRAEGSFVPEILGKNFYNYGIRGTQDDVINFFLSEELRKNKTTPILINFDMDGLDYAIGDVGNYLYNSDNKEVRKLLGPRYKALYAVPFIKYYGKFESYIKNYLNEELNLTRYTNRGGSFKLTALPAKKFRELIKEREADTPKFGLDYKLKEDLLDLITQTNRPIIFVIAPYHKSYFRNYQNMPEAKAFFKELTALPNVRLLDFSQTQYADSLYYDCIHLNYSGAKIFSQQLKDSLQQHIKPDYLRM